MLENKDQITLDSANNVFVGPNGYFKVVIDKFDGTKVQAWHIEDGKGNKTDNLARGEGKHIDVVISRANGTVGQFISNMSNALYDDSQAQIAKLQADMAKLQSDMSKPQTAGPEATKALAEKDAALKQAQTDLSRAEEAAKTAQAKTTQLEKQVSELQAKVAATESNVPVWVPVGVAVIAILILAGMYVGLLRKST